MIAARFKNNKSDGTTYSNLDFPELHTSRSFFDHRIEQNQQCTNPIHASADSVILLSHGYNVLIFPLLSYSYLLFRASTSSRHVLSLEDALRCAIDSAYSFSLSFVLYESN